MSNPHRWLRVTRALPCSVCGHPDWCMTSPFGDEVICCRQESKLPAPLFDGWFHSIPPRQRHMPQAVRAKAKPTAPHAVKDFGPELQRCVDAFDARQRLRAAESLGLSHEVFDAFPIGFNATLDALAFPALQLSSPTAIGIRYRKVAPKPGAPKWICEPNSTAGLLLPKHQPDHDDMIFACEGPSDTLAATQLGLHAVGRWSCGIDARQIDCLKAHAAGLSTPKIVVVGDNDGERRTGARAADSVAQLVGEAMPHATIHRLQPPPDIKDMRAWVIAGASREAVMNAAKEVRRAS
jgi:hypothetical protein